MNEFKIAIIGAGSSYTPELIEGIIKRSYVLKITEIAMVDVEMGTEKLAITCSLAKRMIEKAQLNIKVTSTLDRRSALQGCSYVITQIRVGGLDAREKDEKIPLKYGLIGQETTGAGGFAKALRTIPVILSIAKDMEELCPDAFLINFTNPSGMVTEAVVKHSKIRCI
ncbi:MAG: 6-phospho-beta-glucosidase [Eubacterium sp.]|nr:6-phospho-beta-glucosidase [Eubacterium sp.]